MALTVQCYHRRAKFGERIILRRLVLKVGHTSIKIALSAQRRSQGRQGNDCSLRNLAVFGITPTATAVYSPMTSCEPPPSSLGGRLSLRFTTLSSMLFVGTRSPGRGCENGLSGLRFSSRRESSFGAFLLNALSMDDWPPRQSTALLTDSGRT